MEHGLNTDFTNSLNLRGAKISQAPKRKSLDHKTFFDERVDPQITQIFTD
jgi:hypothetical protein